MDDQATQKYLGALRVLEKKFQGVENSWKFVSYKGYKACAIFSAVNSGAVLSRALDWLHCRWESARQQIHYVAFVLIG